MEVFEIKKPHAERQISRQVSTASSPSGRNSKVGYILTMAGIVLFTSALLVILHFTREYTHLSKQISSLSNSKSAEKLERRSCEVPFCNTEECVSIAATMLESMNFDADPCADFYEYACGGYTRSKSVPYASDSYSPFKEAKENLLIDIRKMMDQPSPENEALAVSKMRRFYKSCMNESLRNELENRTLSFWFIDNEIVPDDYVFGNALDFEHPVRWTKLVSRLEEYQIHTLFKPNFIEAEDSAPQKMEVDCLVPFLNPEAYRNSSDDELTFQLMMYKESMNDVFELLQLDRNSRLEFIKDIMKIELDIAQRLSIDDPSPDPSPYPHLIEEHDQQLKDIWRSVVGNAIQDMEVVSTCKYDMQKILTILNEAPNKNVVKYVTWRMLMELIQYMGTEFRSLHVHYMTKLPGFDYAYESKWKECADTVRSEFGLVALKDLFDNGYLKKDIIDAAKADFSDLKRNIALVSSDIVQGVDQHAAKKFLDKLNCMELETGYKEMLNQDGSLDLFYESMNVDDNYFLNVINMKSFKARKYLTRLWYGNRAEKSNELSLEQNPLGSNSGYDYIKNTVYVDLGSFRPPIYVHSEEIPKYLTFAYSSIIAREMSRAFDATGSFYDGNGQRFEKIWWPAFMEQRYDNALSCMSNQIQRLNINNMMKINDTRVLNNFIADLGSFFVPYERLKTHLNEINNLVHEKPLPGVPLNKKQTFYVQTAQMFCELRTKPASNSESNFLLPPKSRVNGAVSNMEDFGNVFNCPAGSKMDLQDKCNFFQ